ncbi:hypothetical protein PT2222_40130 [Paraburkholderia tropica]
MYRMAGSGARALDEPVKEHDVDGVAGVEIGGFVREHDEAVGFAHRAERAGALRASGRDAPLAARVAFGDAALEFGAACALFDRRFAARGNQRHGLRRRARHGDQGGAHDLVEADHGRDRVAGQAEQQRRSTRARMPAGPDAAERQRAARAHGEAPERDVAERLQLGAREIGFADRDAARGEHDVGARGGLFERGGERVGLVAHHAEIDGLDIQAAQHRAERVAVAVVDAAGVERLAGRAQFVAGRKEGHAQASLHLDFDETQRGQQADVGGAELAARAQRHAATREVFAPAAAVRAGRAGARAEADRRGFAGLVERHALLRHDGVAAGGHRRAGHDAHARAARHVAEVGMPRERLAGDRQRERAVLCGLRERRAVERVTVHRRVVVRGHVDRRDHIDGQHARERFAQRHAFAPGQRRHPLQHNGLSGADGQGLRIELAEARGATGESVKRGHRVEKRRIRTLGAAIVLGGGPGGPAAGGARRVSGCARQARSRSASS